MERKQLLIPRSKIKKREYKYHKRFKSQKEPEHKSQKKLLMWQLRLVSHYPEKAEVFMEIMAEDVIFQPSKKRKKQKGFGNGIIALSRTAVGSNGIIEDKKKTVEIFFNGFYFVDQEGNRVDQCKVLYLEKDGSMRAIFPNGKSVSSSKKEKPISSKKQQNSLRLLKKVG